MTWDFVANIKGVKGDIGNLYVGQIPTGANLNSYVGPAFAGSWGVPLQSIVDGLSNAPAGAGPGTFTVLPVGSTASTHIWMEYLAPGRMFVSAVSTSGRTAPWRDVFGADDGGNFSLSGFTTFDAITKTSNYSLWSGAAATAAGAPIGQVGEIRTYIIGNAGIQTFTSANPVLGAQVFVRGKGSTGWGAFKQVTNQPGDASGGTSAPQSGFKNVYLALNQPATSGTETVSAATVRWPIKNGVASKRARLHVRNWNWATGTTFAGAVAFTGAWMGEASGEDFTEAPVNVLPAFSTASNAAEYVSPWFNYDMVADVQHLLSVGFTTAGGQVNQASRGGCYRTTVAADASLAAGFTGTVSTTSPFDVWLELEVPAATPIVAGFGDSNTLGTGTALPVYDSWLSQYARTAKALPYFSAIHGSNTGTWDDDDATMWDRTPAQARPDAVISFLGQNDLVDGVTLATMQANFNTMLPIIKDKLSAQVYVATITPADAKAAPVNAVRQAYNTWLKTLPGGVKDAFDFSAAISDNDTTIRTVDNSDGLHFVTGGHTKLAAVVTARTVVPPALAQGEPGEDGADGAGVPTGGTALQLVRKDAAGTATEWVSPDAELVGLGNVDNTADEDKPLSAAAVGALAGKMSLADVVAGFIAKLGTRGVTKTIYVRATGNDANDGTTTGTAFREIRAAVDSLAAHGPVLRGSIVIDVGAGTYKGGVRLPLTRGKAQDDFIKIVGPASTHPAAPTAIIDRAADTAATYGILAEDGAALWLESIKTIGAFPIHVDARRNCYVWLTNVHMDGQKVGAVGGDVGLAVNSHCRYYVAGGLIQNMLTNGIQELFGVVRAFNNVASAAAQMTIKNCEVGIQAKENCSGHLDYLNVEDCLTGIEMNGNCVVNTKGVVLKRNALGYANVNSEVHNETSIVWGTGADANTREFISYGNAAAELYASGWVDSSTVRTTNVGHRPLSTVAANYVDTTLVGPTTETDFHSFVSLLKAHRHNTAGRTFKVIMRGTVNTTLVAAYRILLRTAGTFLTDVTIPLGTVAGSRFKAEFTVACTADGNFQKCFSELIGEGVALDVTDPTRTADIASSDRTVTISGLATNAADSVTLKMCEVWA
jgi:lysophospholipase L1-like esterase